MKIDDLPEGLFAEAVALWHEAGLTRPWNDPDADLARAMRTENATVLAARDDAGALLGTAMVGHDGHRGWVYYLAVSSGSRRQGIGRELMWACERWVRDRAIPKIQVMVRHSNEHVIAFYDALGYAAAEVTVLQRTLTG